MKQVHAVCVGAIAAVVAAARAINGQPQLNSSVVPVAVQKHLPRRHRSREREFIHLKSRRRRAGNMRLHHL